MLPAVKEQKQLEPNHNINMDLEIHLEERFTSFQVCISFSETKAVILPENSWIRTAHLDWIKCKTEELLRQIFFSVYGKEVTPQAQGKPYVVYGHIFQTCNQHLLNLCNSCDRRPELIPNKLRLSSFTFNSV